MVALLDTNVLIHAAYRRAPLHGPARKILDRALGQRAKYCIAPQNLVEFAAVVTRKKLVHEPLPGDEVARFVSVLYGSRNLKKIYPKRATVMRALREGTALGITGPAWYDLFLALTMRDAGVCVIVTEDITHYRRFPFVTARRMDEEVGK
jgi:predicted nucleic acid-binding protein